MRFKNNSLFLLLLCAQFFSGLALSSVEIKFMNGKNFIDYRLSRTPKELSLKKLKSEFKQTFETISKNYIIPGHILEVSIRNLDLAGTIEPILDNMRMTGDDRYVMLEFSYWVKNIEGNVIYIGKYKLEDSTRRPKIQRTFSVWKPTDLFRKPLEVWFKNTFERQ